MLLFISKFFYNSEDLLKIINPPHGTMINNINKSD
jgi:hypothetical protein